MDVILDSNIYLGDIRFEKTGFEGLFAYLKRAGHHLVIPEVVFQEVLARHRDRLTEFVRQAKSSWNNVRLWKLSDGVGLPTIDVEAASKSLSERLNQPAKLVKSIRYGKNSKITTMDVALQGINRIKPADADEEQLRDALLWLHVLEYAQESHHGVAFISQNRRDFCKKDHAELHSDLVDECNRIGVKIHFYCEIVDFLRENSLEQSPFTESQLPKELSLHNLDFKLAFHVANTRTVYGYPEEFRVTEIAFKRGDLFKVSDATSIAELIYEGQAICKFKHISYQKVLLKPFSQISEQPAKKTIEKFERHLAEDMRGGRSIDSSLWIRMGTWLSIRRLDNSVGPTGQNPVRKRLSMPHHLSVLLNLNRALRTPLSMPSETGTPTLRLHGMQTQNPSVAFLLVRTFGRTSEHAHRNHRRIRNTRRQPRVDFCASYSRHPPYHQGLWRTPT
jgi:hypothetical protein